MTRTRTRFLGVLMIPIIMAACSELSGESKECCAVTVHVTVPDETGAVFLTGNLDVFGPWVPDNVVMTGAGRERVVEVNVPTGFELEYKFTLGGWDREALGPSGTVMPNFRLAVDGDIGVHHEVDRFMVDPSVYMDDWRSSDVLGTLVYWKDVASEFLERSRHVVIWLPPGYDEDDTTQYPVLYMQDGQNLFDPRIGGSDGNVWDLDDAIVRLVEAGKMPAVIVVGAFNTPDRFAEYSPWHKAPQYARFLIDELMPRINSKFRTLTGPGNTSVMGSSMGGLLSFYLVTNHPDVFGACGCISSHFSLSEKTFEQFTTGRTTDAGLDDTLYILHDIEAGLTVPDGVRYWFDYGTKGLDAAYSAPHSAIRQWLLGQRLEEGRDFVVRAYPGADHNEASWRDRLQDPLSFLYAQPD